jgi:hypothetical protein
MTTEYAAQKYLGEHLSLMAGKNAVCYNPKGLEQDKLPKIFCFSNVKGGGDGMALAVAEDGHVLGDHWCSNEHYVPHDLGVLEGCRLDRHEESYQKHYPEGYQMEFVHSDEVMDKLKVKNKLLSQSEQ